MERGFGGGDRGNLSPPSVGRTENPAVTTPTGDGLFGDLERRLPLDDHAPESLRKPR